MKFFLNKNFFKMLSGFLFIIAAGLAFLFIVGGLQGEVKSAVTEFDSK